MIFELDSINQASKFGTDASKSATVKEITGMIRSALVFSGEILVTDSMLLDGLYFQEIGPHGLASELGVSVYDLPLKVIGVAGSLKESLAQKLANPAFVWQTKRSVDTVWPSPEVAAVWDEWCNAAEHEWYTYADVVRGEFPEKLNTRMNPREYFKGFHDKLIDVATEHEFTVDRSHFYAEYMAVIEDEGESGSRQHYQLYTWWNAAYLQMIAEQNGANWISFTRLSTRSRTMGFKSGRSFKVAKAFLARMHNLTPGAFGTVVSSIEKSQELFMDRPTTGNLRGLVFASMSSLETPQRHKVLRSSVVRAVLALAVIFVSLPFVDFAAIGLTTTWVVFGLMAVATAPWAELKTLIGLLDTSDTIELMMIDEHAT